MATSFAMQGQSARKPTAVLRASAQRDMKNLGTDAQVSAMFAFLSA